MVIRGRVLVIDSDEWLARVLARVLEDKGYKADVCSDARSGFQKAVDTVPDCIVCGLDLPDIDGFWVARRVRTEADPVSRIPFLFVSELPDTAARVQGLNVGADAFLERPVTNDEILAQVEALIAMARRHRGIDDERPSSSLLSAAMRGDLSVFPIASMLMMMELERRTGTLEVIPHEGPRARLTMSHGSFASSEIGGQVKEPLEVLREVLGWRTGKFAFRPWAVGTVPPPRATVGALVLEAMRLEDERKAALEPR